MLKNERPTLVGISDQYTDRSGAVLTKIAQRLADKALAVSVVKNLASMGERTITKVASFPTDTVENTVLSRVYFEGQRTKIAEVLADEIDSKITKYEVLHGIPTPDRSTMFKKAQKHAIKTAMSHRALLPGCKIASKEELVKAGEDFSTQYSQLDTTQRQTFATQFIKAAEEYGVNIPSSVSVYAENNVEVRADLPELIRLRKVAMDSAGLDSGYGTLYENLKQVDLKTCTKEELHKIAVTLDFADSAVGLHKSKRGRHIPDAWHSVFSVKTAEEAAPDKEEKADLTKAELVGRYGDGILEEVEDAEGNIDKEKVKALLDSVAAHTGKSTHEAE